MADHRMLENVNDDNNSNAVRARDINNNYVVESEPDTDSASETESHLDPNRDIEAELQSTWERIRLNMMRLRYSFGRSDARNGPRASGPNPKRLQHHRHGRRRRE